MYDLATLSTFVVVVLGMFLIPGPAVLLVLTRTVEGGRKTGVLTALGVASGDFIHALCAAVGLSALLMTSALAFNLVKYAGAAYLIYLGVKAFMAKTTDHQLLSIPAVSSQKAFFQAIFIEVMNPKTAIFFLAFLPQFVRADQGAVTWQLLGLGLLFAVMSAVYTVLLALLIKPLGRMMGSMGWLKRWRGKILGTILIALGLKVALQQR